LVNIADLVGNCISRVVIESSMLPANLIYFSSEQIKNGILF